MKNKFSVIPAAIIITLMIAAVVLAGCSKGGEATSSPSPSPSASQPPRAMGIGMLSFLGQSLDELNPSLQTAVQQGTLTEQQANSVREWWQQKPDFLNESLFPRGIPGTPPPTGKAQ